MGGACMRIVGDMKFKAYNNRYTLHNHIAECGIICTDKNVGMPKKTSERDFLLNPGIMEGYA